MLIKNAVEYLEGTAALYPDKIAFADESGEMSFAALRRSALELAASVASVTDRVNAPVAVLTERSAASVAAFMGALYAGCFYVPVDADMPKERMRGILERLAPAAVIAPAAMRETADAFRLCPVVGMGDRAPEPDEAMLLKRRSRILDEDPAYVIFTSGSTGEPKGIVVSHRSLIDFVEWFTEEMSLTADDVLGSQAPFFFDLSVKDIYTVLKCGATARIIPKKAFMFPTLLTGFLNEKGVTALIWATSAFHLTANSGVLEKDPPVTVKKVILGGEALRAKQLNIWRRALPDVHYVNLYGPTEVTVDCTYYPIEREFSDNEPVPIGRACPNKEVFLLNEALEPVGPGETGELCVRGSGVAKGYFGDPERTAAAFIPDPRSGAWPERIYRTGDLAVMDEDGVFTFVSRRDGQVKHMGYRVELGEIETAVGAVPGVGEAVCLYDGERDRIVCAYTGGPEGGELARALRAALPRYMIPNIYHRLDRMPRTANGKADRKRLEQELLHGTDRAL